MDTRNNKLKLLPFQKQVLQETKDYKDVAYYYDLGLGKTFIGAEKLHINNNNTNLVVCQKAKVKDWQEHFMLYYDYNVFDLTDKKQLPKFLYANNSVGIINYDMLYRTPALRSLYDFTLLLDESSLLQNIKAKRTSAVFDLQPKNTILLSGTPCGGHYEKLYPQMKLLGENCSEDEWWSDYVRYKRVKLDRYKNTPGTWGTYPLILGYKNVDMLKNRMHNLNCRFKKAKEVLTQLPKKNFVYRFFSNKEYDKAIKTHIAEYKSKKVDITELNPLNKLLVLRFLSTICVSEQKKEYLKSLIQSTDDRILIFYNFQSECDEIKQIANELERPISVVNGKEKDLSNYENKNNTISILQYQSASFGLNLQKANITIYASLPLSSEYYEQSLARTARLGQKNPCYYYILQSGIEDIIYELLSKKMDYTLELFKKSKLNLTK